MRKLLFTALALSLLGGAAYAQTFTKSLQGSQDPRGPVAEDALSNFYFPNHVNFYGSGGTAPTISGAANNGTPYPFANIVVGSVTMSQPGAILFPLQHVVGYFDAVGTLNNGSSSYPQVWILPNEVNATSGIGFIQLPEVLQEPPIGQTNPSQTLLQLRWPVNMMNSNQSSQFMHHVQVKIQFEPENAPNTIKALAFKEDHI